MSNSDKIDASKILIYKIQHGTRVLIPKKDPARRYADTVNVLTGERYSIEFTDAEEAEANSVRDKWEEEAPQRAAEEKRQKEEMEAFRAGFKYKEKIFAFIDILGWSSAVKESGQRHDAARVRDLGISLSYLLQSVKWNQKLREMGETLPGGIWPGDPTVTQFSDCLAISVSPDRAGRDILLHFLYPLCRSMMHQGFLLRGGIVKGLTYHSETGVYGPALIDAYHLENVVAKHPRIVLSTELAEEWGRGEHRGDVQARTWRLDRDGHRFYDFMQPFNGDPFFVDKEASWAFDLKKLREIAVNGLQVHQGSNDVVWKYLWLADYVNELREQCMKFGIETVEKIVHSPDN